MRLIMFLALVVEIVAGLLLLAQITGVIWLLCTGNEELIWVFLILGFASAITASSICSAMAVVTTMASKKG